MSSSNLPSNTSTPNRPADFNHGSAVLSTTPGPGTPPQGSGFKYPGKFKFILFNLIFFLLNCCYYN